MTPNVTATDGPPERPRPRSPSQGALWRLQRAAVALAQSLVPEEVQQAIVARAREVLQADAAALLLPGAMGRAYVLCAQEGLAGRQAAKARVPRAEGQAMAQEAGGRLWGAGEEWPAWARGLPEPGEGRALAVFPLLHEGHVLGLVVLLLRGGAGWQPELAAAFAALAAAAVHNADLHREAEYGAAESTFLLQISQLLSATFDAATIGRMVAEEAADLMDSDVCALYLCDPLGEAAELLALNGATPESATVAGLQRVSLEGLPGGRQAAAGGQLQDRPWPSGNEMLSLFGPALGVRAALTIPLRARDSLLGFLLLGRRAPRSYSLAETQLGVKLGTLAALALDNARLYANLGEQMEQVRMAQAQLIEAEKMAALGRIVAGVAHELNNPLAIISGYAQMLLDGGLAPEIGDDVERIDRAARRAAQVVRDLLAFARQQPIAPGPLDVGALVQEVLAREEAGLREAGIALEVAVEEGLPRIRGDHSQLAHVLSQLIANARQAIARRPGAGRLTIGARRGERVQLLVADDGPGIPLELQDRVFEPFAVAQETGLGLSMCYGVVKAHGGRIWVENNPTVGATFFVELPRAEEGMGAADERT